jgi:hypothetical protein
MWPCLTAGRVRLGLHGGRGAPDSPARQCLPGWAVAVTAPVRPKIASQLGTPRETNTTEAGLNSRRRNRSGRRPSELVEVRPPPSQRHRRALGRQRRETAAPARPNMIHAVHVVIVCRRSTGWNVDPAHSGPAGIQKVPSQRMICPGPVDRVPLKSPAGARRTGRPAGPGDELKGG